MKRRLHGWYRSAMQNAAYCQTAIRRRICHQNMYKNKEQIKESRDGDRMFLVGEMQVHHFHFSCCIPSDGWKLSKGEFLARAQPASKRTPESHARTTRTYRLLHALAYHALTGRTSCVRMAKAGEPARSVYLPAVISSMVALLHGG